MKKMKKILFAALLGFNLVNFGQMLQFKNKSNRTFTLEVDLSEGYNNMMNQVAIEANLQGFKIIFEGGKILKKDNFASWAEKVSKMAIAGHIVGGTDLGLER